MCFSNRKVVRNVIPFCTVRDAAAVAVVKTNILDDLPLDLSAEEVSPECVVFFYERGVRVWRVHVTLETAEVETLSCLDAYMGRKLSWLELSLLQDFEWPGDFGVAEVAYAIARLTQLSKLTLVMRQYGIVAVGANMFSKSIGFPASLCELSLNLRQNRTGSVGAAHLGKGIAHLTRASKLNIDFGGNCIFPVGAKIIIGAVSSLSGLSQLVLDLHDEKLSRVGVQARVIGIDHRPAQVLDIKTNETDSSAVGGIGNVIRRFTDISELVLQFGGGSIDSKYLNTFGNCVHSLTGTSSMALDLGKYSIDPVGIAALANGIRSLRDLSHLVLDLRDNRIGSFGALDLGNAIGCLQGLSVLGLDIVENNLGVVGTINLVKGIWSSYRSD